jgi:hypothetical protein
MYPGVAVDSSRQVAGFGSSWWYDSCIPSANLVDQMAQALPQKSHRKMQNVNGVTPTLSFDNEFTGDLHDAAPRTGSFVQYYRCRR